MAARTLPHIARELVAHGRSPDTPVAVTRLNTAGAATITTTLCLASAGIDLEPPVVVVVGEVAALGERLREAQASASPRVTPRVRGALRNLLAHEIGGRSLKRPPNAPPQAPSASSSDVDPCKSVSVSRAVNAGD